jgi:hypothetical protein
MPKKPNRPRKNKTKKPKHNKPNTTASHSNNVVNHSNNQHAVPQNHTVAPVAKPVIPAVPVTPVIPAAKATQSGNPVVFVGPPLSNNTATQANTQMMFGSDKSATTDLLFGNGASTTFTFRTPVTYRNSFLEEEESNLINNYENRASEDIDNYYDGGNFGYGEYGFLGDEDEY